ncbi:hypothetical protein FNV43_RR11031 [Rhamnella rubrinervis]|uniref:Uncharacterized protein n=1 Tax=Rhamnella rubrinervis TaxID=2594499 RepID=A0A8K0H578_9ROSA|nr:hypothetical protein FNV43_RR11031 [Rhamnella rubrinervis]
MREFRLIQSLTPFLVETFIFDYLRWLHLRCGLDTCGRLSFLQPFRPAAFSLRSLGLQNIVPRVWLKVKAAVLDRYWEQVDVVGISSCSRGFIKAVFAIPLNFVLCALGPEL